MAEFLLGIPSVLLDDDTRRRSMYGAAGAIRIKAYGVEYRVLSNFWVENASLQRWVFENASLCVDMESHLEAYLDQFSEDVVQECINNSDVELAKHIVDALGIPMP
jgi:hypothetical protein